MNFEDSLLTAVKKLEEAKRDSLLEDYVVIGALALSRVATVRSTGDIDFAIKLGASTLKDLAKALKGEAREGEIGDPLLGCVNFSTGSGRSRVNIQLVQFPRSIEDAAFDGFERQRIKNTAVPFAAWKGLLILKLYAGSALDLEDAQNLFRHNKCTDKEFEEIRATASKLRLSKRLARLQRE